VKQLRETVGRIPGFVVLEKKFTKNSQLGAGCADMDCMIDFGAPLAGIQRAETSLNRTAVRLASLGAPEGDSVDLSAEAVAMLAAKTAVQVNVNVARAEADLSRTLLDILS
jgi:hypothetical protein